MFNTDVIITALELTLLAAIIGAFLVASTSLVIIGKKIENIIK